MLMLMIGYSTYSLIVIRSSANPPMDQNSPEDIFTLGNYLSRDQYGDRPLFYGPQYTSQVALDVQGNMCIPRMNVSVDRGDTADDDLGGSARAAARRNLHAVHLALEGVHGVAGGDFGNLFALDGRDRAGEVTFLDGAVAHDNHLVEGVHARLEDYVDGIAAVDTDFLRLAAHIRECERAFGVGLYGVVAVDVGGHTGRLAGQHACADERFAILLLLFHHLQMKL